MKKIFMVMVLFLVCTMSFGQDRVNRVNPTYVSEGYTLTNTMGWNYNDQLGQWIGHPNVIWNKTREFRDNWEDVSRSKNNIYDLQFKTIVINEQLYYILIFNFIYGRYLYPTIYEDWFWTRRKEITILTENEFQKLCNLSNTPISIYGYKTSIDEYDSDQNEINYILQETKDNDDFFLRRITIYQATDGSIRFNFDSTSKYNVKDNENMNLDEQYFEISGEEYLKLIMI